MPGSESRQHESISESKQDLFNLYDNAEVAQLETKLGPLHCEQPPDDGVRLVKKATVKVPHDAIYTGEWYWASEASRDADKDLRHGYGMQVWEDGSK